jgi:uncharacterized protein YutE (UPF0331/DUF86 family)/predicted nucleotidyltransferase
VRDNKGAAAIVHSLVPYFAARPDIAMAFLFGSQAKAVATGESDVDVAVYLLPTRADTSRRVDPVRTVNSMHIAVDIESSASFPQEDEVWSDVERLLKRETDLVILNRAPAMVCASVFYEGVPIVVKDGSLYWRFFLEITHEAEDFRRLMADFRAIKQRARSLSETDRGRLARVQDFLEDELGDAPLFAELSKREYTQDRSTRRNVERWVENVANATIDLAKIILASERQRMPQTYQETISRLGDLPEFDAGLADELAGYARLRNFLAHEYLDIRFARIRDFIDACPRMYDAFGAQLRAWLARQDAASRQGFRQEE